MIRRRAQVVPLERLLEIAGAQAFRRRAVAARALGHHPSTAWRRAYLAGYRDTMENTRFPARTRRERRAREGVVNAQGT